MDEWKEKGFAIVFYLRQVWSLWHIKYILYYMAGRGIGLFLLRIPAVMNYIYHIPEIFISSRRFYYVLLGNDGFYISANQYFLDNFSMSEDDLEKRPALEYVYQEDRDVCEEVIEWCFKNPGKPYSLDVKKLQTDDIYQIGRWELSAIPNSLTGNLCIQCVGYDITEEVVQKEAAVSCKQEIVSKQKIFERLLSNSIDVILLTDKTNTITYCSPNVKKVMGYEPEELIGKNGFSFVHPDDRETAIKIFEDEYLNPEQNNSVDLRFLKKDGSWLWAEAKGKNLFNDSHVQAMLLNLNDISLRKKAEQDLAENELRYKTFFHQLPLPLFVIHKVNTQIIDANSSAIDKYGYSKEELLQLTFCDLFQDKIVCSDPESAYNKKEPVYHIAKNGRASLVTIEKQAIDYEDGHSCLVLITDITETNRIEQESKLAYEELKISNERYELIKKAANEAIWDFDIINQTIIRSNGYKTLFGYDTDKEHSDLNFWESKLHLQDRERVINALHQFIANANGLNWQCEYRFQRIDGTYAYVSDKGYLIFDKARNPIRMVGSMQDITEQKEFAEKLKISNERYELVTKATNEAIWDLDLTNHEIIWSEGYKTLFGHDFNDTENGLDFWASNIHPQEQEKVINGFNDFLLQHNTPFWSSEYRFMRKDGSYAHVLDKGYLIFDKENKPLRMVGSMQDITERKELEQELLIREKNRQNQIAQAVVFAQEKERAEIGKELHDNVGQLLTTTKLYLEMLRHKQQDPLELIERGTKHINTVISEIRNLSRSLVPSSITDLGLIASVNDLIESIVALGNMEIDFFSDPDLENRMNESLKLTLYRILQEQMNNIVRHAEACKVSIELFEEDNFISLIITDDGNGFDTGTVKRGQGLKNINSRAELQNGSAEIISHPGKGCKLKVQILVNN